MRFGPGDRRIGRDTVAVTGRDMTNTNREEDRTVRIPSTVVEGSARTRNEWARPDVIRGLAAAILAGTQPLAARGPTTSSTWKPPGSSRVRPSR
jgi:hypothetical protein